MQLRIRIAIPVLKPGSASLSLLMGTILLVSCLRQNQAQPQMRAEAPAIPKEWKIIEVDNVSFSVPPTVSPREVHGIDSAVWLYSDDDIRLEIDYGPYSDIPEMYREKPLFDEYFFEFEGGRARVVSFLLDESEPESATRYGRFIAGANFPATPNTGDSDSKNKLTFWATCRSATALDTAKLIFRTVRSRYR